MSELKTKEKAIELTRKYWDLGGISFNEAKEMAKIAVDEILSLDTSAPHQEENYIQHFYSEVKQELEKL